MDNSKPIFTVLIHDMISDTPIHYQLDSCWTSVSVEYAICYFRNNNHVIALYRDNVLIANRTNIYGDTL